MLVKISVCNRRTDKKYKNKELEWDYIADRNDYNCHSQYKNNYCQINCSCVFLRFQLFVEFGVLEFIKPLRYLSFLLTYA